MEYKKTYTKEEAIQHAENFLAEVRKLEEQYSLSFNSDREDVYLSFKKNHTGSDQWGSVKIGWKGDGTGLRVMEKEFLEDKKQKALAKLTEEDKKVLGLK
jgi:hypothetical protein